MRRFFLLLFLIASASAQEQLFREVADPVTDTHIEVTALFSRPAASGYLPVRVKMVNNLSKSQYAELSFDDDRSSSFRGGRASSRSSFRFELGPNQKVTRDILVAIPPPSRNSYSESFDTRLTGSFGESRHSINLVETNHSDIPSVLISEKIHTENGSAFDKEITSSSSSSSNEVASHFEPKDAPDDWLAYSGYDSIIMTSEDWADLSPGARNAVSSWLRLGGHLTIYHPSASAPTLPKEVGYGEIDTYTIESDLKIDVAKVAKAINDRQSKQYALNNNFTSAWSLQSAFGKKKFFNPLVIISLLLFGILVGPVNLFVFAKPGKRQRLFITTPLISLGASLLMIALIMLQDGFGGDGVRRVLMEVRGDQGINAAHIHQEQFCRTGILANTSFTMNTPATINPVRIESSRWARFTDNSSDHESAFNIQLENGKMFNSGSWFQSRSEQGHVLSAVVATRGRIEKTSTSNTFVSTFEYPIQTLYYLDEANQWHHAEQISTGKNFTLTPIDENSVMLAIKQQQEAFTELNSKLLSAASARPGHFLAITDQAPGIETHPSIRWKKTQTVITGPVVAP